MNGAPEVADSLAVNDSYFENATSATFFEIVDQQILDFARVEIMQIKDTINRYFDWQISRIIKGHSKISP